MSDINLLPEDKRKAEKTVKKGAKNKKVEYTDPAKETGILKTEKGGVTDYFRNLFDKIKRKEFLKPTEIKVEKPVAESYDEVLKKESGPKVQLQKEAKPQGLPKVKVVEPIKPKISFWQKMRLSQAEKRRKKQMMDVKKVAKFSEPETKRVKVQKKEKAKEFIPLVEVPFKVKRAPEKKENNKKQKMAAKEAKMALRVPAVTPQPLKKKVKKESKISIFFRNFFASPENKPRKPEKKESPKKEEKKEEERLVIKELSPKKTNDKAKKPGLTSPPPEIEEEEIEVNLLPERVEIKEVTPTKFFFIVLNSILATLVIAALAYLGIYWYLNSIKNKIISVNERIAKVYEEVSGLESQASDALNLQKRIGLAGELLSDHVYWSNFFEYLEKKTIKKVYFIDLQASRGGQIILTGAAENFTAVGEQLKVFEEDKDSVTSASVDIAQLQKTGAGAGQEILFNVYLQLKSGVFKKD